MKVPRPPREGIPHRLAAYLDVLAEAAQTNQITGGDNVTIAEYRGKGTVIDVGDATSRRNPVGGGGPPPPPTGACCHTDGSCTVVTSAVCSSAGGTWQGAHAVCTPNPCPGACCFTDGTCTAESSTACASAGGVFYGGSCTPNPCPQPTGACCSTSGVCTVETAAACSASGGSYLGNGTTCSPNPCHPSCGGCSFVNPCDGQHYLSKTTTGNGSYHEDPAPGSFAYWDWSGSRIDSCPGPSCSVSGSVTFSSNFGDPCGSGLLCSGVCCNTNGGGFIGQTTGGCYAPGGACTCGPAQQTPTSSTCSGASFSGSDGVDTWSGTVSYTYSNPCTLPLQERLMEEYLAVFDPFRL